MMSLNTFLLVYLLGGVTFLPLLAFVLVATTWTLLPRTDSINETIKDTELSDDGQESAANGVNESRSREQSLTGDTSVSGTFAVLRRYDLQAATVALNARSPSNVHASGGNSLDSNVTGDHGFTATSESVYQSMYRSVFDRNKTGSGTNTLLENDDELPQVAGKPGKRKTTPANVMFIVLRHGHLMLYDSPAQVEVKHVISLAHYQISLKVGDGIEELEDGKNMHEADLFIKRTAIVLYPVALPYGTQRPGQQSSNKPFYLFSNVNIEREDFYHALLSTRSQPPIPQALDTNALIKLQSNLHSVTLTPETRAINALVGRVFLSLQHTDNLMSRVRARIEKKLSRIQKPSFIPTLIVQSIELGDAGPIFSNPRLRDLNISGDLTISADMRYNGGLSITLFAVAKLDLGSRFKARTVDLVLKTTIQRIQGTMLLRIKPPPSNRIWTCFEIMPEMDIRVEPVVSDRKITYGFVLRTIEDRLRATIAEGLVKPNWDDTPMPLSDTRGSIARGGIWADEGQEEIARSRSSSEPEKLNKKHERTMSLPTFPREHAEDAQASGVDLSAESELASPKLRHTMTSTTDDARLKRRPFANPQGQLSTPGLERAQSIPIPPRPLRSPSLTSSLPSVAVDGLNVEPVRSDDATLRQASMQNRRMWRSRGSDSSQPPKDALEELRVVRDRAEQAIARPSEAVIANSSPNHPEVGMKDNSLTSSELQLPNAQSIDSPSITRPQNLVRTNSDLSTADSTTSARSQQSQQSQQRKQTLLAATAAATNAARTWGWNAIQRNKTALPRGLSKKEEQPSATPGQPMGRGQPLPPPGVPLPGPQKTMWSNMGNLRRKPVPALPPRRPLESKPDDQEPMQANENNLEIDHTTRPEEELQGEVDDEFGPWRENSGTIELDSYNTGLPSEQAKPSESLVEGDMPDAMPPGHHLDIPETTTTFPSGSKPKRIPPPLPARLQMSIDPLQGEQRQLSATTQNVDEQGLRVPEPVIEAVAAENATPALAHGISDDFSTIDEVDSNTASAVDESQSVDTQDNNLSNLDGGSMSPGEVLQRIETKERFTHGKDLAEEDFARSSNETENRSRQKAKLGDEK